MSLRDWFSTPSAIDAVVRKSKAWVRIRAAKGSSPWPRTDGGIPADNIRRGRLGGRLGRPPQFKMRFVPLSRNYRTDGAGTVSEIAAEVRLRERAERAPELQNLGEWCRALADAVEAGDARRRIRSNSVAGSGLTASASIITRPGRGNPQWRYRGVSASLLRRR